MIIIQNSILVGKQNKNYILKELLSFFLIVIIHKFIKQIYINFRKLKRKYLVEFGKMNVYNF